MRRGAFVFIAPLLFLAAGCGKAETPAKGPTPMTQSQTITTRPLCVGRFLIDVPVDAKVSWTVTRTSLTGVIKMEGPLSERMFATRMRDEQEQMQSWISSTDRSPLGGPSIR